MKFLHLNFFPRNICTNLFQICQSGISQQKVVVFTLANSKYKIWLSTELYSNNYSTPFQGNQEKMIKI